MNVTLARPATRRTENIFFTGISLVMLAIAAVGFAPSYFLKGAVFAHLPSLLVHFHGAVFSSSTILFVVQCLPCVGGNVRLHRKLGALGAHPRSLHMEETASCDYPRWMDTLGLRSDFQRDY